MGLRATMYHAELLPSAYVAIHHAIDLYKVTEEHVRKKCNLEALLASSAGSGRLNR
jgi:hypothetical protein